MAVGIRGVGPMYETTVANTSSTPQYAPNIVSGDLLLLLWVSASGSSNIITSPPSGWTELYETSSTGGTVAPNIAVLWKYADSTDAAHSANSDLLTVAHGSTVNSCIMLAFSGVDQTTFQNQPFTTEDKTTGSTTSVIPGATLDRDGCAVVTLVSLNNATASTTEPSGFTEVADRVSGRAWNAAYKLGFPSGPTGNFTTTFTGTGQTSRDVAVGIFLNPAPVANDQWTYVKLARFGI